MFAVQNSLLSAVFKGLKAALSGPTGGLASLRKIGVTGGPSFLPSNKHRSFVCHLSSLFVSQRVSLFILEFFACPQPANRVIERPRRIFPVLFGSSLRALHKALPLRRFHPFAGLGYEGAGERERLGGGGGGLGVIQKKKLHERPSPGEGPRLEPLPTFINCCFSAIFLLTSPRQRGQHIKK